MVHGPAAGRRAADIMEHVPVDRDVGRPDAEEHALDAGSGTVVPGRAYIVEAVPPDLEITPARAVGPDPGPPRVPHVQPLEDPVGGAALDIEVGMTDLVAVQYGRAFVRRLDGDRRRSGPRLCDLDGHGVARRPAGTPGVGPVANDDRVAGDSLRDGRLNRQKRAGERAGVGIAAGGGDIPGRRARGSAPEERRRRQEYARRDRFHFAHRDLFLFFVTDPPGALRRQLCVRRVGSEGRHQLGQRAQQRVTRAQAHQLHVHDPARERVDPLVFGTEDHDLGMLRLLLTRGILDELLGHFLPGFQAHHADLDVAIRLETRQEDQAARQFHDADLLPHLQHEDLAALGQHGRLQHQAHRFLDRHEVARGVRMRERDRLAFFDLALKDLQHRPGASQHVPEAHGREAGLARVREVGDDDLGGALGGPHHAGGPHGFVRRDQDEGLGAVPFGRAREIVGSEKVVAHALVNVRLELMDVLVRGRVEDDLRTVLAEHPVEQALIAHVAQQRDDLGAGRFLAQLGLAVEQGGRVVLQEDDLRGLMADDLARQLAADRAAGARHQDDLARDRAGDARRVERDDAAVEQVGGLHLAGVGARLRIQHLVEVRRDADDGTLLDALERVGHRVHDAAAAVPHGDDDLLDRHAPKERRQRRDPSDHRNAVHAHPPFGLIVVAERRDAVVDAPVRMDALVDALAEIADADDHRRPPLARARSPRSPVILDPADEGM